MKKIDVTLDCLKTLLVLFSSVCYISSYAYDFKVDGLFYNRISGTSDKVEVTYERKPYQNYSGSIFIPDTVTYSGKKYCVTSIGDHAFYGCPISFISIPNTISSIGEYAFYGCGLKTITLPNSIESIGEFAFYALRNLTTFKSKIKNPPHKSNYFNHYSYNSTLLIPYGTKGTDSWTKYYSYWQHFFKTINESPEEWDVKISSIGNGTVYFGNLNLRMHSHTYECEKGISPTIEFEPDSGYRIKHLIVNDIDQTSNITNNSYIINSISSDTYIKVEFEAIPPTTYTLSIKSTGSGKVTYADTDIRDNTSTFTVNERTSATITLTPDDGYRIKSFTVNDTDVKSSISNNQYTISSISANTSVEAEFEAIPKTTYTLTIKATGNGSATYNETSVKNETKEFSIDEGTNVSVSFNADEGNRIKSLKSGDTDVTSSISNSQYTINNFSANTTLDVEFEEVINAVSNEGVNYSVVSQDEKTVNLASGDYKLVLKVPASFTANNIEWKIVGIEKDALKDNSELAAIIWNPEIKFTEKINNPNLLLYVKSTGYAPSDIKNVIADNKAKSITLTDAASGNNFYCPQEFTAEQISYEHNYSMKTGYNTCQGWESIVLPFDVAAVTNNSGTELVAYPLWNRGDSKRPFWLYSMNEDGWKSESAIKANTPYIISMPNNENYDATYNQSGNIVFSASNVKVKASDNMSNSKHGHRNLVPNYQNNGSSSEIYALNVNTLWDKNTENDIAEGSAFIRGLRQVRPFEAYMTIDSGGSTTRSISIFGDGDATGIMDIPASGEKENVKVYSLSGALIKQGKCDDVIKNLTKGIYIINKKKVVVR